MNEELFNAREALTFDDVLVVPGYSEVLPSEVDVHARLTRDILLNVPVLSAAMDTVSEARLAIALAREGGLGIIHRNMAPDQQANEVDKVKRSQAGMISDPVTLPFTATLQEAENIMANYKISGVPIVDGEGLLTGILTNRDIRFVEQKDFILPISQFMTPRERLVTAPVGISNIDAKALLQKHRIEKLLLVDPTGKLKGLLTVKDILTDIEHPNSARDQRGRLRVGAAVGVGPDLEGRVGKLSDAGVDIIVIDTAHGHSKGVVTAIQRIRALHPKLSIAAGNVVTAAGTRALIEAGADAVKVGVGAGSICTTRIVAGAGMPSSLPSKSAQKKHAKPTPPSSPMAASNILATSSKRSLPGLIPLCWARCSPGWKNPPGTKCSSKAAASRNIAVWAVWARCKASGATATPVVRAAKANSSPKVLKDASLIKEHCTILSTNWSADCAQVWATLARQTLTTCAPRPNWSKSPMPV